MQINYKSKVFKNINNAMRDVSNKFMLSIVLTIKSPQCIKTTSTLNVRTRSKEQKSDFKFYRKYKFYS